MSIFLRPGRHAAPVTGTLAAGDLLASEELTGYPYLADFTEGPGGEVTGRLSLGAGKDGEVLYRAEDPEALTRLIVAADVLRRRMRRGRRQAARRVTAGGAA
jgi:hypothetical protein